MHNKIVGEISSVDGVLADFSSPILPKIGGDLTREALIDLHQLISGNAAPMALNLRGDRNVHLTLTTIAEEYMAQTVYMFVPPNNPDNFPPIMGNAQEKVLGTERFKKNQSLFRRYTALEGALKNRL